MPQRKCGFIFQEIHSTRTKGTQTLDNIVPTAQNTNASTQVWIRVNPKTFFLFCLIKSLFIYIFRQPCKGEKMAKHEEGHFTFIYDNNNLNTVT